MSKDVKRRKGLWGRALAFGTQAKTIVGTIVAVLGGCVIMWGYLQSYRTGLMDAGAKAEQERQRNTFVDSNLRDVKSDVKVLQGDVTRVDSKVDSVNSKLDLLIQLYNPPGPVARNHRLQLSPFPDSETTRVDSFGRNP